MMCRTHGTDEKYTIKEALTAFRTVGYEYVDMNLWQQSKHDMPLSFDNWREMDSFASVKFTARTALRPSEA